MQFQCTAKIAEAIDLRPNAHQFCLLIKTEKCIFGAIKDFAHVGNLQVDELFSILYRESWDFRVMTEKIEAIMTMMKLKQKTHFCRCLHLLGFSSVFLHTKANVSLAPSQMSRVDCFCSYIVVAYSGEVAIWRTRGEVWWSNRHWYFDHLLCCLLKQIRESRARDFTRRFFGPSGMFSSSARFSNISFLRRWWFERWLTRCKATENCVYGWREKSAREKCDRAMIFARVSVCACGAFSFEVLFGEKLTSWEIGMR